MQAPAKSPTIPFLMSHLLGENHWHLAESDFAVEHVCSWEEGLVCHGRPLRFREYIDDDHAYDDESHANEASACLAHTQATAVISTIPNPDQTAYTIPVGMVRSGKERSQNAATKQMTDMMLGTGLVRLLDAASAIVAIASVRIVPARHK
jgi:hypothetical protein